MTEFEREIRGEPIPRLLERQRELANRLNEIVAKATDRKFDFDFGGPLTSDDPVLFHRKG